MTTWTDRHNQAIDKTYNELMSILRPSKSVEEAKDKLKEIKWPYGTQIAGEGPSGRVKRELAQLAIVEHAKLLMEESMG
jgi:hypothetical protein